MHWASRCAPFVWPLKHPSTPVWEGLMQIMKRSAGCHFNQAASGILQTLAFFESCWSPLAACLKQKSIPCWQMSSCHNVHKCFFRAVSLAAAISSTNTSGPAILFSHWEAFDEKCRVTSSSTPNSTPGVYAADSVHRKLKKLQEASFG